ncbi:UMP-CMP kinase family protein [Oopsacas minuta]|uniref:UMP-CMP kinase family protein n=1 Tax=Oopsacas minuta TaxID=111878 RepID=A0AAV7K358_9METZ|nr:UMP-CMP kinase family protein [Oopsacas minuta]
MAQSKSAIPQVVFVLGPPGSGKGTQCAKLVEEFKFTHLSAGELLRGEITKGSKDGALIQKLMDEGKIVPVDITCRLLYNSMQESSSNRFLIDGFPRNKDNVDGWERIVGDKADVKFCLFLDCPKEVCLSRIMSRHEGRTDDTPEKFKLRIDTYFKETVPIIEHFGTINKLRSIPSDRTIEHVYADVKTAIGSEFEIGKFEP